MGWLNGENTEGWINLRQLKNAVDQTFLNNQYQDFFLHDAESGTDDDFDYDLQVELERRFQELFGNSSSGK